MHRLNERETDVLTDGDSLLFMHNGNLSWNRSPEWMHCHCHCRCFLSVNHDPLIGCAHAAAMMGIVGEMAFAKSQGPGSFKAAFQDTLYSITLKDIEELMRVEFQ